MANSAHYLFINNYLLDDSRPPPFSIDQLTNLPTYNILDERRLERVVIEPHGDLTL
jgi:hypothetical protein